MRRLPVYILIETSAGMRGERIEAVKNGLQVLISNLRQDPFALESVWVSIIAFDRDARLLLPLTNLESLQLPDITVPESGPPHTGRALLFLSEIVGKDIIKSSFEQKGDWKPLLFILTKGKPGDERDFLTGASLLKNLGFGAIVACSTESHSSDKLLKVLTDTIVHLDTADSSTLMSFFRWVSASIGTSNRSIGASDEVILPPPPQEVHLII